MQYKWKQQWTSILIISSSSLFIILIILLIILIIFNENSIMKVQENSLFSSLEVPLSVDSTSK